MRFRIAGLVLAALCAGSALEAGWFRSVGNLPTALDYPYPRPKLRYDHKLGTGLHGPAKYHRPSWGAEWKTVFKAKDHRLHHSLFVK